MKKPSVLIADDHTLVLEGIKKLLENEVNLVGMAEDGMELIRAAHRLKPDIIILDISMPLLNGVEAARRLRKTLPRAKLIFLTMHGDATYVVEALRLGVSGYVLKRSAASELITAIREVTQGRTYVTSLVKIPSNDSGTHVSAVQLTARQREILQLICEGRCPKEISSLMAISVRTVEFHKYSIMKKLGLNTIAELTKYAIRHRITEE
jgi:DNA-binding NarL/FixJ family response regulator